MTDFEAEMARFEAELAGGQASLPGPPRMNGGGPVSLTNLTLSWLPKQLYLLWFSTTVKLSLALLAEF